MIPVDRRSAVALLACCAAGCGGHQAATSTAPASPAALPAPRGIAPARVVAGTHPVAYAVRRMRLRITPVGMRDPAPDPLLILPRGTRPVLVVVALQDLGRDTFPFQILVITGTDSAGHRGPPAGQTGPAPIRPGAPRPRADMRLYLRFAVPGGRRLRSIEIRSLLAAWPFHLRWQLPNA